MTESEIPVSHPGVILFENFMEPNEISRAKLARDLQIDPRRNNQIAHGKRAISVNAAIRLAKYFGTSEQFGLNLQQKYDIRTILQKKEFLQDISLSAPTIPIRKF